MSLTASYQIIIIGAGIAGLFASIALASKGHNVTVVESSPGLRAVGSAITIPANAAKVLAAYSVYEAVSKRCGGLSGKSVWRRYTGEVVTSTDAVHEGVIYKIKSCEIHRADLQETLFLEARIRGVKVLFGRKVTSVDEERPALGFEDGQRMKADLIVAADGNKSRVRRLIGSPEVKIDGSMEICHVYLRMKIIESDVALAGLVGRGNLWMGPGRASLGVSVRRDTVDVWTQEFLHAVDDSEAGDWGHAMNIGTLKAMHADFDPLLLKILDYADNSQVWKVVTVEALSHSWVSGTGKVVLVGDAAHAMMMTFGQGGAMGIEDGASLAECLSRCEQKEDIPRACRAFEAIRKPRVAFVQRISDENKRMMTLPDGKDQQERDEMLTHQKLGENWDGKHVDYVPESRSDPTFAPYIYGHDTIGFTNRQLDNFFVNGDRGLETVERK